ncbi:CD48 antigen-like isoform X1 [Arapaima gigas]
MCPVCSGEIPMFFLKGAAARFAPNQTEGLESIIWKVNSTKRLVYYNYESNTSKCYDSYKTRVKFNPKTLLLVLENVSEVDNGLYTARVTERTGSERDLATFLLSVQGGWLLSLWVTYATK